MKVNKCVSKFLDSNTFIVIKNGEAIIIDAAADLQDVVEAVEGNRVLGIFLTHGHYDHSFYVLEYVKKFKCPVFGGKGICKVVKNPDYNYGNNFSIDLKKANEIEEDCKITCGGIEVKAYLTKGHSECSMSYQIEDDFFAGDTVFHKGIGRTDLITSDNQQMFESLKKINQLNFKALHSGHGSDSTREEQDRNLATYIKFLNRK